MADEPQDEGAKSPGPGGDGSQAAPEDYRSRLDAVSKWAVAGLAALGGAAVTKLSLDRLGKGDLEPWLVFLAYVGLLLFAIGASLLVAVVVWQTQASRVTLGYILSGRRADGTTKTIRDVVNGKQFARQIEDFFNSNTYMLGGQPDLKSFRDRLNRLMRKPRPMKRRETAELKRLLAARDTILQTGANERTRLAHQYLAWLIPVGALLATLGAATFALATNQDLVEREDRLAAEERHRAQVVTGELLPKAPSPVIVAVPTERSEVVRELLGSKCSLDKVNAIVLEIGTRPLSAEPTGVGWRGVMHVVTERTADCKVRDLWVPAEWVMPRPPAVATTAAKQETATSGGTQPSDGEESPPQNDGG